MPADKEHFAIALHELVSMCTDAGMSPCEFIGPLKTELATARLNSMPSKFDDTYNSEQGLPPMTAAAIRQALELENCEQIPPQRETNDFPLRSGC